MIEEVSKILIYALLILLFVCIGTTIYLHREDQKWVNVERKHGGLKR